MRWYFFSGKPINQPMTSEHLRCFLSTDTELSGQAILEYYAKRWSIESYFRQTKETLGFDRYRIRHERAIKRYWVIVQFTYIYCMTGHSSDFSTGLASVRSRKIHNLIEFIYYEAQRGMPLDSIKNQLRVA
ncbi:hypothetical protein AP3564_01725 [Aeribacillus pallidus]|uniref:Transposase IS4-like domain-containing protein n=1 Tax=Aeribacillus pallidus TaxID=33936 RepID=A0A223E1Y0_9BACI|nr:hypothetical protein AP3564_01725 [Aeribacillus pallidus]